MVVQAQTAVGGEGEEQERRSRIDALKAIEQRIEEDRLMSDWNRVRSQACEGHRRKLEELCGRGYAFGAGLRGRIDELGRRAMAMDGSLQALLQPRLRGLRQRLVDLRERIQLDSGTVDAGWLARCDEVIGEYRKEAEGIEAALKEALDDVPRETAAVGVELHGIEQTLRRVAEASFPIEASREGVLVAVEAEWKKGKSAKENPDGVLYVTDRRIVMERKEKEGGFLGFGGQKVQGVVWEVPLSEVEALVPEERGFGGGVDLVHLRPKAGAGWTGYTVEIKGNIDAHPFVEKLKPLLEGRQQRG